MNINEKLSNENEISFLPLPYTAASFLVLEDSVSSCSDSGKKPRILATKQDSDTEKSLDKSSNSNKVYQLEVSIAKTSLINSSENNFEVQIKSLPKQSCKMEIQIDDEYENWNSLESDDDFSGYCSDHFSLKDSRENVFVEVQGKEDVMQIDCRETQKKILKAVDKKDQDDQTYSFIGHNNFIATEYNVTVQESSSESSSSEYESERNSNYDTPS